MQCFGGSMVIYQSLLAHPFTRARIFCEGSGHKTTYRQAPPSVAFFLMAEGKCG